MSLLRSAFVSALLSAGLLLPLSAWLWGGLSPGEVLAMASLGLRHSVDHVGFVLLPQLIVAIAIATLFISRSALRAAGAPLSPAPAWLDAAIESALLLGMLGTIAGMVGGFVAVSPDDLEAGSLIHSLGTALRSSAVGFAIALVGVWARLGGDSAEAVAQ